VWYIDLVVLREDMELNLSVTGGDDRVQSGDFRLAFSVGDG
jgi:hypothetical protein